MTKKSRFVIVAVDFAKTTMKVQAFLDRETVAWKKGLNVENTREGLAFLLEKLDGICSKWRIRKESVVFGGEDPAPYAMPFIESLKRHGFLFVAVNAREASNNRDNTRASSDLLDLDGIAETMRKGIVRDIESSSSIYAELKQACRSRQQALVFLGLLDSKSGVTPLGSVCLTLLDAGLTSAKAQKMTDAALLKLLRKSGAYKPEKVMHLLRDTASRALEAPQDLSRLQETLRCKIATLRAIRAEIACEEGQMTR